MVEPALTSAQLEAQLAALHDASFGWARSCCHGNPDDAADLLQSCYMKVLSGRARFAGRSQFRTWFFGVIRLTALESHRRGTRELALVPHPDDIAPPPTADAALLAAEETARLQGALSQLPDRQRELLHLVFYQELSISEAAVVMELSVGTARVHYDRGKKRLRTLLAPPANSGHAIGDVAS